MVKPDYAKHLKMTAKNYNNNKKRHSRVVKAE